MAFPSAPAGVSPEFAFVCACAGPLDPSRSTSGDARTLDGDTLAAVAHRHQVAPLVVAALCRSGTPIPSALAAGFDPLASIRSAREALRLNALLATEQIEALFLKGSTLAVLAYGAIDRRQFGDIDLLVRPTDARRAATVLGLAGYRLPGGDPADLTLRIARLSPLAKDIVLRHADTGQIVELHWRMTDNPRERPVWEREEIQSVALAPGRMLATLGTEALFAYCCGHGAAHLWARMRWLADVAALLARAPDGGDRLWHGALERGKGRAAASAILLSGQLFGTRPPPSFSPPASLRLTLLMWASARVIHAGGGTTELARTRWRGWAEMAAKLLVAADIGDLVGWTARLLYSVTDAEAMSGSRAWYVLHPMRRIPALVRRRRRRRAGRRIAP